ncbi:DUF4175 family protein [bacterium]|jgi:hypothetical protein|nr:DUF4175 family protein [bacterium]
MDAAPQDLKKKLDDFVRKYHRNEMLRGALILGTCLPLAWLAIIGMEALGQFGTAARTILFYLFVAVVSWVTFRHLLLPALRLIQLRAGLNHDDAARIIGRHFPEIEDRLLNTLQLQERSQKEAPGNRELLEASIAQRSSQLKPYRFTSAVDFGENRQYLKFALPPIFLFAGLYLALPEAMEAPTDRLLHHRTEVVKTPDFRLVHSGQLQAIARTDYTLNIRTEGSVVPPRIEVEAGEGRFRMERRSQGDWTYTFRSVQASMALVISAPGTPALDLQLTVLPRPELQDLRVEVQPPTHTGMPPFVQQNEGDLDVPEGSLLKFQLGTRDAETLRLKWGEETRSLEADVNNRFSFSKTAETDLSYQLQPRSDRVKTADSVQYRLRTIADRRPTIRVAETKDNLSLNQLAFNGMVQDDYGFTSLRFVFQRKGGTEEGRKLDRPSRREDGFIHFWDLSEAGIGLGDEVEYWFEVRDNDGVNGPKMTRSRTFVHQAPTAEELAQQLDSADAELSAALEENLEEARRLREQMQELRRELMEEEELGWEEKAALEELLKQQEALREEVEKMQEENRQKNKQEAEFAPPNEELLKKQEELQKLMDDVMTDELQKMFDEMRELMEELEEGDKEKIEEQLEKMDLDQEAMEQELDRALEQFKQLQWEQKMDEAISDLEKLAEKQEALAEETAKEETPEEELKAKQDSLNQAFEKIQEALDDAEKLNDALENPNGMPKMEELQEEIEQQMDDAGEQLDSGKEKKASASQKGAAKKMEQMAQQMESAMEQGEQESMEEDMEALRALLENIITLSFDEEDLMASVGTTQKDDPRYVTHGQVQRKLKDDAEMVKDSLFALSKRVTQLQSIVNREISLVNLHMGQALAGFTDRKTPIITSNQQYVMTSFNNLALLLDEVLQQMQSESSCDKPGTGNCEKPGGSGAKPSPSAKQIKGMQQSLSKQLERMKEKMKGFNQGEGKEGKRGMSKEMAQMAAQQAAIRQMTQELGKQLNEDGSGEGNGLENIAKEMEDIEKDIVRGELDQLTLDRQQDILTRLLEAENAERIRGEKEERESRTARETPRDTPPSLEEYQRRKAQEIELLRTVPADLTPYYKLRVNDYFNTLELPNQE